MKLKLVLGLLALSSIAIYFTLRDDNSTDLRKAVTSSIFPAEPVPKDESKRVVADAKEPESLPATDLSPQAIPEEMTADDRKNEIGDLEKIVEEGDVIRRLNANEVTVEERKEYSRIITRIANLKAAGLTEETESLGRQVEELEASHAQKLEEMNKYLGDLKVERD